MIHPCPRLRHHGNDFAHEQKGRAQIDRQKPAENGLVQIKAAGNADAGPVEEQVHTAVPGGNGRGGTAHGFGVGQVHGLNVRQVRPGQGAFRGQIRAGRLQIFKLRAAETSR